MERNIQRLFMVLRTRTISSADLVEMIPLLVMPEMTYLLEEMGMIPYTESPYTDRPEMMS